MTQQCGDDLIAARRFTDLCHTHMSEIFSGGQLPLTDVLGRLDEIKTEAKSLRARSIYKTAQTVIDDLTGRRSVAACAGSVLVLQKLIQQYEGGLSEIAPVMHRREKVVKAAVNGPAIISDMARQREAVQTLSPLIKFAGKDDQANLVTLVNLAANSAGGSQEIPGKQRIDIIMPGLTNHWLRLARAQSKSISVSAALDEALLETGALKKIQKQIKLLGEILISQSIELPEKRADKGLSRSAHMAITAKQSDKMMHILISCEGAAPRNVDINPIITNLEDVAGQARLLIETDLLKFEIRDIPCFVDIDAGERVREVAQ